MTLTMSNFDGSIEIMIFFEGKGRSRQIPIKMSCHIKYLNPVTTFL
jgi:hypothetical protein